MALATRQLGVGVQSTMQGATSRSQKWALTAAAFDCLLAALDTDREQAAQRYQALHTKLVKFFEWQQSRQPEEQADEVINRLTRRLAAGQAIDNIEAYAYGGAKLLVLEGHKATRREEAAHRELPEPVQAAVEYGAAAEAEEGEAAEAHRAACFDECLARLAAAERELIMTYYAGEVSEKIAGRKALAARLGVDLNAVRVRAHRIRTRLEACVTKGVAQLRLGGSGKAEEGRGRR